MQPDLTKYPYTGEYTYNCVDDSVMYGPFKKYYCVVFYKLVPAFLTANIITLVSSAGMWMLLYISFNMGTITVAQAGIAFAFLMHFYVVGDHLDGMRAKLTRTSSPLGEYLDHYFDIYSGAITVSAFIGFFAVSNNYLFYFLQWFSYLTFASIMMEEKETGAICFAKIGSLEGVIATIIFFLSFAIDGVWGFWQTSSYFYIPNYYYVFGLLVLSFITTTGDVLLRVKKLPPPFTIFIVISLLLCYLLSISSISKIVGWFVLAAFCGDYIGRLMISYFKVTPHPLPDIIAVLWVLLLSLIEYLDQSIFNMGINIFSYYMIFKVLYSFTNNFNTLSSHWLWINPKV